MKNLVIFMDCHGTQIDSYLLRNEEIRRLYNIINISLNEYVVPTFRLYENKELHSIHKKEICYADVLIIQIIEKDRGYLNNIEVIKNCKPGCTIIRIPHYRNSVYIYKTLEGLEDKYSLINNWKLPEKINDINNVNETIKIIKDEIEKMNNLKYEKEELDKALKSKIEEFSVIDELSDIKMYDYYLDNYRKNRLFQGRWYPSSIFFFELTNRIIERLGVERSKEYLDLNFAENTGEPIPHYWYNYCNFEFGNIYYTFGHIPLEEHEWYYILLLSKDVNISKKRKNIKLLNQIR
jgi:hypothetical protein